MLSFKQHIELEEEQQDLVDLCLQLIGDFITENYDFTNESIEISDNAEIILDVILEHFVENYDPFLVESNKFDGFNKNDELVLEIYNVLLDESIGTFIANIVHGAGGERRAYTKAKLKSDSIQSKNQENAKLYNKKVAGGTAIYNPVYIDKETEHKNKLNNGNYGKGISGAFKRKIAERGIAKSKRKYEKAESKLRLAQAKEKVAGETLRNKEYKQGILAHKIDRAIRPSNIARAAIKGAVKGTIRGISWAVRKITGRPARRYHYSRTKSYPDYRAYPHRYQYYQNYRRHK